MERAKMYRLFDYCRSWGYSTQTSLRCCHCTGFLQVIQSGVEMICWWEQQEQCFRLRMLSSLLTWCSIPVGKNLECEVLVAYFPQALSLADWEFPESLRQAQKPVVQAGASEARQRWECSVLTGTAKAFKDGEVAKSGSLKQNTWIRINEIWSHVSNLLGRSKPKQMFNWGNMLGNKQWQRRHRWKLNESLSVGYRIAL